MRLKSGGPAMTVEEVGSDSSGRTITCVWFVEKKAWGTFFPETLVAVGDEDGLTDAEQLTLVVAQKRTATSHGPIVREAGFHSWRDAEVWTGAG